MNIQPSLCHPLVKRHLHLHKVASLTCYLLSALLSCLLSAHSLAEEPLYQWRDGNGTTVFSDQQRDGQAKAVKPQNAVNYYQDTTVRDITALPVSSEQTSLSVLSAQSDDDLQSDTNRPPADSNVLTESSCQQLYNLSCDRVINWRQYALQACGNDERCSNDDYLDRKYRPRTVAETQAIARRAGVRKNQREEAIDDFLKRKYTNFCQEQATLSCQKSNDRRCQSKVLAYCKDERSLDQLFARYNQLSPQEKQAIIDQAQALATANGLSQWQYDKLLLDLLELFIQKSLLGV